MSCRTTGFQTQIKTYKYSDLYTILSPFDISHKIILTNISETSLYLFGVILDESTIYDISKITSSSKSISNLKKKMTTAMICIIKDNVKLKAELKSLNISPLEYTNNHIDNIASCEKIVQVLNSIIETLTKINNINFTGLTE